MQSQEKTSTALGPLQFGRRRGEPESDQTTQVSSQGTSAAAMNTKPSVLPLQSAKSVWLNDFGSDPTVRISSSSSLVLKHIFC